ncbi:MAG: SDR family NAD(P)-dependent oxidoreductase [Flavobacteriaceae bacterium]
MAGRRSGGNFPEGVAVVAGGSGGIGAGICEVLSEQGSAVAVLYRQAEMKALALVEALWAEGGVAEAYRIDLTDAAATADLMESIGERFGRIHTGVYAAGPVVVVEYAANLAPSEFAAHLTGDAGACFNFIRALVPHMRDKGGGALVAVTTDQLHAPEPKGVLSSAPKAAVEKLFEALAREEARHNIRAATVRPGWVDAGVGADILAGKSPEVLRSLTAAIPLRRFGEAREIGEAVAFLASRRASYITGVALPVNGGRHL